MIWNTRWVPFLVGGATGLSLIFRDLILPDGSIQLIPRRANVVTTFTVIGAIAAIVSAIIAIIQLLPR